MHCGFEGENMVKDAHSGPGDLECVPEVIKIMYGQRAFLIALKSWISLTSRIVCPSKPESIVTSFSPYLGWILLCG